MNTNTDITIYNKYYDVVTKVEVLRATYFMAANWYAQHGVTVGAGGESRSYRTIVRIPQDMAFLTGKTYVEPDKYRGEPSTWTMQNGDLVVKGDNTDLRRESDITKLDSAFRVASWSDNRRGSDHMKHFKLEGI